MSTQGKADRLTALLVAVLHPLLLLPLLPLVPRLKLLLLMPVPGGRR